MKLWLPAVVLMVCVLSADGQQVDTPAAATVTREDLPPSTILQDEVSFLDRVRSDMANWSDVELAAFQATTAKAKADCNRIEQTPHEGDEELALARLCALGWDWDGTYSAARWYTRRSAPPELATHLSLGYALLLRADLNLQATARALDELKEMHERLPLSDDTDQIFTYTIATYDVMRPKDAVTAAMLRQAALLEAVAGKNATVSAGRAEAEAWHVLAVLHTAGKTEDEAAQKALLLAAIAARTTPLSTTDAYTAQRGRAMYEWLGKEAPAVNVGRSTYVRRAGAAKADATLLVVQAADSADVPALALAVDSLRTHLAPKTDAKLVLVGAAPAAAASAKRPSIHAEYTSDALLKRYSADAGPLFVVVDGAGRVQWMGVGTAAWLNPQQQAEVLLGRFGR